MQIGTHRTVLDFKGKFEWKNKARELEAADLVTASTEAPIARCVPTSSVLQDTGRQQGLAVDTTYTPGHHCQPSSGLISQAEFSIVAAEQLLV